MALIRTRAKPAGRPVQAVQFKGDPSVHRGIFWDTDPHIKNPHWRVRTSEDRGSLWLGDGYWLIGEGHTLLTVSPEMFARDWEEIESPFAGTPEVTAYVQQLKDQLLCVHAVTEFCDLHGMASDNPEASTAAQLFAGVTEALRLLDHLAQDGSLGSAALSHLANKALPANRRTLT